MASEGLPCSNRFELIARGGQQSILSNAPEREVHRGIELQIGRTERLRCRRSCWKMQSEFDSRNAGDCKQAAMQQHRDLGSLGSLQHRGRGLAFHAGRFEHLPFIRSPSSINSACWRGFDSCLPNHTRYPYVQAYPIGSHCRQLRSHTEHHRTTPYPIRTRDHDRQDRSFFCLRSLRVHWHDRCPGSPSF